MSPRTEEQELTANPLCTATKIITTTQTTTTTHTHNHNHSHTHNHTQTTTTTQSNPPTSTMIDVCIKMEYAVDECENNKTLEGINSEHCREVKSFYVDYCDDFDYIYYSDYVPDYLSDPYELNNPTDDNTCNYDHFGDIKNMPTSTCRKTFKAVEHCGFGEDGAVEIDIEDREPCQAIWNQFKKFCGYFEQPCISESCQYLISIGEMCAFGSYAHPAVPDDEACEKISESFKMRCGYNY